MDDIEKELSELKPIEQDSFADYPDDDLKIFDKQTRKTKERKKEKKERKLKKREREIFGFLDEDDDEDESLDFLVHKKLKGKNEDIFDTSGKKKKDNLETKFKTEQVQLDKVLKDTETVYKDTKELFDSVKESKARGSGKLMTDLIACLNSSNTTRLQVIKEKSNLKKIISDLKIKLKSIDKSDEDEGDNRYFGAKYLNSLFKSGRGAAIDTINKAHADGYDPDNLEFEMPSNMDYIDYSSYDNMDIDDLIGKRIENSENVRSKEADLFIKYEYLKPQICIVKSQYDDSMDFQIIAIDKDGNTMPDDYPLPSMESLGKVTFNYEARTATDSKGRTFKLILDSDL